jgi:hypothetical protein
MIVTSPQHNSFYDVFEAHKQMNEAWKMMNKTSTAIMGKKFYSKETKKTWEVVNIFERGHFKNRQYGFLLKDLTAPPLGFFSKDRWRYGWSQPHLFVAVEVLEELFKKGNFQIINYEWDAEKVFF